MARSICVVPCGSCCCRCGCYFCYDGVGGDIGWCRRLWLLLSLLMLSALRLYTPPLVQDAGSNSGGGGEEDERDVEGLFSLDAGLHRQGG